MLTWEVLSKIPDFVLMAGMLLYGINWITARREHVRAVTAQDVSPGPGVSLSAWLRSVLRTLSGRGEGP